MHFGLPARRISDAFRGVVPIRREALVSVGIPKGAALIRGRRLFKARRFLKEIRYWTFFNNIVYNGNCKRTLT